MRDNSGLPTYDLETKKLFIGYARVSTNAQDLNTQIEMLTNAGCIRVFYEKISGAKNCKPELEKALDYLRDDKDVLVCTSLDRIARSTPLLLRTIERIKEKGAGFKSLSQTWADTTSPAGNMVLTIFAGIAEYERSLIISRTQAGREKAKKNGVAFGRKAKLDQKQINLLKRMKDEGQSPKEICASFQISKASFYRYLDKN